MSILVDRKTKVLVQGITGSHGSFHAKQMLEYGTKIVGGVTPGKEGQQVEGVPVFNRMEDAVHATGADASVIYVPARFAPAAVREAAAAGVRLIVCITEGIPALEMARIKEEISAPRGGNPRPVTLIGPNCPGIITPGECKIGIMPGYIHKRGPVGVISRSGTLTYEAVWQMTSLGIGQSTCIGIGGDAIVGTTFVEALGHFAKDPETKAILLIGEIGGSAEEEAAQVIQEKVKKPVAAFVAGRTAPPGKRMGHAGAIIGVSSERAEDKIECLRRAGVRVADSPAEIGKTVAKLLTLFFTFHFAFLPSASAAGRKVVADFDSGAKPTNLGQEWGTWNYDPKDPEQGTYEAVEPDDYKNPGSGYCLRIDYDVQSVKPAFSGVWMKLGGLDANPYEWLSLWVRGDDQGKFTRRFKLELKNAAGKRAVYLVEDLEKDWREVRIPFKKNASITDWKNLSELVLVFDDILATYREGTIFLDQIEFQK